MAKNKKQADIDKLASARSLYEKGSKRHNEIQNSINKLMGVSKRHEVKNAPTHEQMKIAKSMKNEITAKVKSKKRLDMFGTAVNTVMKKSKKYAGDM